MAYLVRIASRAERDLFHIYGKIHVEHAGVALEWYFGLKKAIFRLQERPSRCPFTRNWGPLRHLLYGHKPHIYHVIFRVLPKPKQVEVLHVRHGARRKFKPSDIT